jgi:putative membrane protein
MKSFLIVAALLHLSFMVCELYPWQIPVSLAAAGKGIPAILPDQPFTPEQQKWLEARQELTATIVHNAGIYNGIVAGGLFWAAYAGIASTELALVMLIGAVVAGIFGTATLKSPITAVQAAVGIIGVILVLRDRRQNAQKLGC